MTAPDAASVEPPDVPMQTAAELAAAAGLPVDVRHCPACDTDRDCQELIDHPDEGSVTLRPYACQTCNAEFSLPAANQ